MGGSIFYRPALERAPTQAPPARRSPTAPPRAGDVAPHVLNLGANGADLLEGIGPLQLDLGPPLMELPEPLPHQDFDPRHTRGDAIADTLADPSIMAPTVSGNIVEGLARGGEAFFKASAARRHENEEQADRNQARNDDWERRQSYVDAINAGRTAAHDHPDDPHAADQAITDALAPHNAEAAYQRVDNRAAHNLERADTLEDARAMGPIEAENSLLAHGYRRNDAGGYDRFGPAADDWQQHQEQNQLERARIAAASGSEHRQDQRQAGTMRGQFMQGEQNFTSIRDAYSTVTSLAGRQNALERSGAPPSATSDVAMIYAYMKMLDPTSVVREGEFATAQNATGVPQQIQNMYNRAVQGTRLNRDQRASMVRDAQTIYETRAEQFQRDRTTWSDMASHAGYDVDTVAPDLRLPPEVMRRNALLLQGMHGPDAGGQQMQHPDGTPLSNIERAGVDAGGNRVSPTGTQRPGPDGRIYTKINPGADSDPTNWRREPAGTRMRQ